MNLNYHLSKANPTPDLRSAIHGLSLEPIFKREGGVDKEFLSVFVPKILSVVESLVCLRLSFADRSTDRYF